MIREFGKLLLYGFMGFGVLWVFVFLVAWPLGLGFHYLRGLGLGILGFGDQRNRAGSRSLEPHSDKV